MGQRKYPPLTPIEVVEILRALGFTKRDQVGSHAQYFKPACPKRKKSIVTVDMHYSQFDAKLLKSIIGQSLYTRGEFYGATKSSAKKAGVPLFVVG